MKIEYVKYIRVYPLQDRKGSFSEAISHVTHIVCGNDLQWLEPADSMHQEASVPLFRCVPKKVFMAKYKRL